MAWFKPYSTAVFPRVTPSRKRSQSAGWLLLCADLTFACFGSKLLLLVVFIFVSINVPLIECRCRTPCLKQQRKPAVCPEPGSDPVLQLETHPIYDGAICVSVG